mgnify:CR=1 FL=1
MPRTCKMSFGVEPSDRPGGRDIFDALDAALDRALHLGLDPLRNRCQIETRWARSFLLSLGRRRTLGARRPRRAGRSAGSTGSCGSSGCSIALISLSWPSIDCSRSAMPTICARLGRFMLTRYFSISSPSCFCAPAATPPTWFITLENSGDAIAWLAKELNPFSISPIIVLPDHGRIVALVGHWRSSGLVSERLPRFACLLAIPHRCGVAVNTRRLSLIDGLRKPSALRQTVA